MDRSWMKESRLETAYKNGVEQFLAFAYQDLPQDSEILCPCINCKNRYNHSCDEVRTHLSCDGIIKGYTTWVHHGENYERPSIALADVPNTAANLTTSGPIRDPQDGGSDGMRELLYAVFGRAASMCDAEADDIQSGFVDVEHNATEDHVNPAEGDLGRQQNIFASLLKDVDAILFSGCKYCRLSFLVHLYHLKCLYGWSQESFTALLDLLSAIPRANLPKTYYEAKKIIRDLGLDYVRIHACPKDCILFRGDFAKQDFCHVCKSSRWKVDKKDSNASVGKTKGKRIPAKVLRYFPLIPRIQRLFSTTKTSDGMRWHDEGRTKDGKLHHPADGEAWKDFDDRHPDFAKDARNVRLGLPSDGFNPFGNKKAQYMSGTTVLKMLEDKEFVLGKRESTSKMVNKKGKDKKVEVESDQKRKLTRRGQKKKSDGGSGKVEKKPEDWLKKRSIFFELSYWEHNKLRHNIDVMHLEKNVCDNFIATLLDICHKTKDDLNARLDLIELGIQEDLHPVV